MRTLSAVLAALAVSAAPAAAQAPPPLRDAAGIHVVSVQALDDRLLDVTMRTDALPAPVHTRILLPAGYPADPARSYPALYMLHGSFADDTEWTRAGDAEAITAGLPVIAVMPDGGAGGWYSNWLNHGRGGPPEWERFHIDELIPWVDRNLRTVAARGGRAIVGLSMGGFGAMSYAARHPDLFVAAASFSGAVDSNNVGLLPIVDLETLDESRSLDIDAIWGSRLTDELVWRAHNPWDLAANLRGLRLAVYTGNGRPGPFDSPAKLFDPIESGVHAMSVSFHGRLDGLGIAHTWQDYGSGTHSAAYWQRDLRSALPAIMAAFAQAPAASAPFSYRSGDARYAVYGWSVAMHRAAGAFSELDDASGQGFTLHGSGSASVVTPPAYAPGTRYAVTIRGVRTVALADAAGRLHLQVPLGPSNSVQEFTLAARLVGARTFATTVRIGRP
ncbi:MAG: hypothetical protein JWN32_4085 [Solirubrobacterales bacterium]|nr:hypothetical protein [Solirubrobacterales bacterium]